MNDDGLKDLMMIRLTKRDPEKHHGKTAHQAIMQTIIEFSALAPVIDLSEVLRKRLSQSSEAKMFFVMHSNPLYII
jgi:hypothetical protein